MGLDDVFYEALKNKYYKDEEVINKSTKGTKYYLNREIYEKELNDMCPKIRACFEEADGQELTEKMSSIASSSRLSYVLFKDYVNSGFVSDCFTSKKEKYKVIFEGKLRIKEINSTPNIDVVLISKETVVFIEVKMKEIYSTNSRDFSPKYKEVLKRMFPNLTINSKQVIRDNNEVEKIYIEELEQFKIYDFAQTIKHFLGIQNFIDNSNDSNCQAELINNMTGEESVKYQKGMKIVFANLFYDPNELVSERLTKRYQSLLNQLNTDIIPLFESGNNVIPVIDKVPIKWMIIDQYSINKD